MALVFYLKAKIYDSDYFGANKEFREFAIFSASTAMNTSLFRMSYKEHSSFVKWEENRVKSIWEKTPICYELWDP